MVYRAAADATARATRRPANDGGTEKSRRGTPRSRAHARLQIKAVAVTLAAVMLFFTGLPLELVALARRRWCCSIAIKPEKITGRSIGACW